MLCKYVYRTKDGLEHGYYQADTEDFKKLFANKKFRTDLSSVIVVTDDKIFLWTPPSLNKLASGWQVVSKSKLTAND